MCECLWMFFMLFSCFELNFDWIVFKCILIRWWWPRHDHHVHDAQQRYYYCFGHSTMMMAQQHHHHRRIVSNAMYASHGCATGNVSLKHHTNYVHCVSLSTNCRMDIHSRERIWVPSALHYKLMALLVSMAMLTPCIYDIRDYCMWRTQRN